MRTPAKNKEVFLILEHVSSVDSAFFYATLLKILRFSSHSLLSHYSKYMMKKPYRLSVFWLVYDLFKKNVYENLGEGIRCTRKIEKR
jgi:hypothetical protein